MGKKINPKVIRLGVNKTWTSKWFAEGKDYAKKLEQDIKVKRFLLKDLREAGVDHVEVERSANKISVSVYTAKPGIIIGRGGQGAEDLKKKIHDKYLKNFRMGDINLNIYEMDRPGLSAQILVQSMAIEIEKRMPFRRVMKQAIGRVERAGALGVRVNVSGRLNGAEIAREEMLSSGSVPLATLRADIDYARGVAKTAYGTIGIKVWIYKGDVFDKSEAHKGDVVGNKRREGRK